MTPEPEEGDVFLGAGSKAGGPDDLLQLAQSPTVSENTLRQGITPG